MATIRIVDDWRRSPASAPSHWRSVMVIAEKWAEQRVLMRAYAESRDQVLPTIMLHGVELAIGPAGLDVNGSWGVHVDSAEGGRAQHVKELFESAARRLAGSKGNPPRLVDEEPTFEREPTANWGPGAPRILPPPRRHHAEPLPPVMEHVAHAGAMRVPQAQIATYVPHLQAVHHAPSPVANVAPSNPELRISPLPRARTRTRPPMSEGRTVLGYSSGSGAQSAVVRLGLLPQVSARLGRLVDRIVPQEFHIDARERRVLNALGVSGELTARAIGHLVDEADAVTFMEELVRRLESYALDLVEPGEPYGDEPTYRLRR